MKLVFTCILFVLSATCAFADKWFSLSVPNAENPSVLVYNELRDTPIYAVHRLDKNKKIVVQFSSREEEARFVNRLLEEESPIKFNLKGYLSVSITLQNEQQTEIINTVLHEMDPSLKTDFRHLNLSVDAEIVEAQLFWSRVFIDDSKRTPEALSDFLTGKWLYENSNKNKVE